MPDQDNPDYKTKEQTKLAVGMKYVSSLDIVLHKRMREH